MRIAQGRGELKGEDSLREQIHSSKEQTAQRRRQLKGADSSRVWIAQGCRQLKDVDSSRAWIAQGRG